MWQSYFTSYWSAAVYGTVARMQVSPDRIRRVTVEGAPEGSVQAALKADPLTQAYRNGGMLLRDDVTVS